MQVVIMAAGRGTRMGSLTEDRPKPMLEVAGKTLLEHKFDALPDSIDEIIIVVGYRGDVIKTRFGDSYQGRPIRYVTQENPTGGTADAVWKAKDLLTGKFLVLNGDDVFATADMEECLAHDWAILIQRVSDTSVGGKVLLDATHHVIDIIENNSGGDGAVSANMYVLDTRIFDYEPVPKKAGSAELGLPQTILAASKKSRIPFNVVEATRWIQIKNPNALLRAEELLAQPS